MLPRLGADADSRRVLLYDQAWGSGAPLSGGSGWAEPFKHMSVEATLKFGFERRLASCLPEGNKIFFTVIFFQKWHEVCSREGSIPSLGS